MVCYAWYVPVMSRADDWSDELRARIRSVRQARSLSYEAAATATGIAKASIVAIEGAESQNVYLDQLTAFARGYGIDLRDLVDGWRSRKVPRRVTVVLDDVALHEQARTRLRLDRGATGTPSLATSAGMEQSTIVRWESGEYHRIDVIRLRRCALALGKSLADWIVPTVSEQSPVCPTPPPA